MAGEDLPFRLEAGEGRPVGVPWLEDLQRDQAPPRHLLPGQVHHGEAALADLAEDAERTDALGRRC
jgi:hypothetical protein